MEGNYATESSEYAEWKLKTSAAGETYVIYGFDCSSIPTNASIVKVVLTAKTQQTNIANAGNQVVGLLVSSTVKASQSVTTTSVTTSTIESTSLTRSDLDDCRIRVYCRRDLSSTTNTYYGRIYGATLTVTYQV